MFKTSECSTIDLVCNANNMTKNKLVRQIHAENFNSALILFKKERLEELEIG
jgi:hypothetical protein